MTHRPLRWLSLDLNSYFASVEQQEQPHLRGRPIAVAPVGTPSGTIIAASYEAKAFGVRTGHRVREAVALCPDLIPRPRDTSCMSPITSASSPRFGGTCP